MKISVIIPTLNRAKLLNRALESLYKQTLSQNFFEVIVADNGSTDNTKQVVENFQSKITNLKYIYVSIPGSHVARHKGLFSSKGDILVYIDDDSELFRGHLENVLLSFENPNIILVGGKNLPRYELPPPKWIEDIWNRNINKKWLGALSILDFGDEPIDIEPRLVFSCNLSIRKKILLEAKGFHPCVYPPGLEKYMGDGENYVTMYVESKNYKALYNPKCSVYHWVSKERITREYFYKRNFNQGISDSYTDIRNGLSQIKIKEKIERLSKIESKFTKNYLKGYQYHQNEVAKDKDLLAWVKKDNYL